MLHYMELDSPPGRKKLLTPSSQKCMRECALCYGMSLITPCHFTWLMTHRHDRSTSGIRNAEMKWTNHGNLSVYGVRLEGWPTSIPMQNPSTLSTSQNRDLRDALASGTLKFCRINTETATPFDATATSCGSTGNSSDLSWAIMEEFNTPVRCFLLRVD
jgi:hypothetical protein